MDRDRAVAAMQAPTFLLVLVGGKVKWLLIGIVAAIALIVASLSVTAYGLRRDRAEFDAQVTADVQKSLVLPDNTAVREVRCQSGKLVAAELVLLPGYLMSTIGVEIPRLQAKYDRRNGRSP